MSRFLRSVFPTKWRLRAPIVRQLHPLKGYFQWPAVHPSLPDMRHHVFRWSNQRKTCCLWRRTFGWPLYMYFGLRLVPRLYAFFWGTLHVAFVSCRPNLLTVPRKEVIKTVDKFLKRKWKGKVTFHIGLCSVEKAVHALIKGHKVKFFLPYLLLSSDGILKNVGMLR